MCGLSGIRMAFYIFIGNVSAGVVTWSTLRCGAQRAANQELNCRKPAVKNRRNGCCGNTVIRQIPVRLYATQYPFHIFKDIKWFRLSTWFESSEESPNLNVSTLYKKPRSFSQVALWQLDYLTLLRSYSSGLLSFLLSVNSVTVSRHIPKDGQTCQFVFAKCQKEKKINRSIN